MPLFGASLVGGVREIAWTLDKLQSDLALLSAVELWIKFVFPPEPQFFHLHIGCNYTRLSEGCLEATLRHERGCCLSSALMRPCPCCMGSVIREAWVHLTQCLL